MKNIEETMKSTSGTVFLYTSFKDEQSHSFFLKAAECTGRRFFCREDCQALDPVILASSSDKKVIFAAPSMIDFLDRYLEACPAGQRHLLIHAHEAHETIRSMSFVFHDFWEERHIRIEELCTETGLQEDEKSESPLLNLTSTVHWQDRWWLLDVETNGLHPQEDEIIALYLARMENFAVDEERVILIRPQKPLEPRVERLTGISNQDLERGIPLEDAMRQLKELERENFLIHDRNFTLPFLERACAQCHIECQLPCVLLDRLAALLLRGPDHRRVSLLIRNLLKRLPEPPGDWPNIPPKNRYLAELYQLALALFRKLAVEYEVHDTSKLVHLFEWGE